MPGEFGWCRARARPPTAGGDRGAKAGEPGFRRGGGGVRDGSSDALLLN